MRVERFKDWLAEQLRERGVEVERYQVDDGITDLAVKGGSDDAELRLRIVRTSPAKGENHDAEEQVTTREPGTTIEITRR
ncbi:hypothetical protein B0I33_103458 [Prauserella shujinwangii]|uniref:Uncharacterized protein n=1 Tax=Prauserella shujinwangii TaxID=1453103 RepID=A0A2T0LZ78_9PSEU|nr:hypothetical protein [Prauserella shujinwangii]PRX49421.1 hypothetical protein B0I33_103458 [Prauserella shujinwangii]